MTREALKDSTIRANRAIVDAGLVLLTWGNASVRHPSEPIMAIKPSGVPYDDLDANSMVLVSIEDGSVIVGDLRPSSDTATHLSLYRAFPETRAIVHTHSPKAVAWSQAGRDIPILGTTHADHFRSDIPVTRSMSQAEVSADYEENTGAVIVETFRDRGINPAHVPAVLVAHHGPFAWGGSAESAVENAIVLEAIAAMAMETESLKRDVPRAPRYLMEKHWLRKHGADAYYGQK